MPARPAHGIVGHVIRPNSIFCRTALACVALAALVGGPRLCEASNDFSRRIAEHASKAKCTIPTDRGSTERQNDTPAFTAAPDVCVSKSDTDGRWTWANDFCACKTVPGPDASRIDAGIPDCAAPHVRLHAPVFNATAPPCNPA